MSDQQNVYKTVDHLFRHESGKMVSVLTRIFGFSNIEQAEDIVQDTLLKALEIWKWGKIPDNPQAWLYKAAKNKAIDIIRREKLKYKIENEIAVLLHSEYSLAPKVNEMFTDGEIKDSQLRMMFACCHSSISQEAQITLMLKTLCGLSVKEISSAFLTNEETISKRLYRTKVKIREEKIPIDYPGAGVMPQRIDAVLKTLYLLFNEGYNSSHPEKLIREDLCEEAMRLAIMLSENFKTNLPQTNALLALMCFQVSRFGSRLDDKGMIILLKDQDRKTWNKFLIQKGNEYMTHASSGDSYHDFHIEAGIASIHANAAAYDQTNWQIILGLYDSLFIRTNNPLVALNRCLVLAELEGPSIAIEELLKMNGLSENCHYHASLGEMYFRSGEKTEAKKYFLKALDLTTSNAEADLIRRKLSLLES
ncbi:MAG: sigma-70 family RNA polymerase sigma factor [Bacteroidetes bacterium]|nr:sigma-70 family RNA polymerase sigma factor [Bacteroidota bacterium]